MLGTLIVIDGADGAGKATQTKLLVERLRSEGQRVETLDFPRYTTNVFGALLRECLDGTRGDFMALDPKIASTLYACDRYESKQQLIDWLNEGVVVVLDRYVSANMLHQGSKAKDVNELTNFLAWLDTVEYGIFGMPRPDAIIFLDAPISVRMDLKQQALKEGKHTGELDVAEADTEHQTAAEQLARDLVSKNTTWKHVDCCRDGEYLSKKVIHEKVYEAVATIISQ